MHVVMDQFLRHYLSYAKITEYFKDIISTAYYMWSVTTEWIVTNAIQNV
jgi:hypothetical protein